MANPFINLPPGQSGDLGRSILDRAGAIAAASRPGAFTPFQSFVPSTQQVPGITTPPGTTVTPPSPTAPAGSTPGVGSFVGWFRLADGGLMDPQGNIYPRGVRPPNFPG